MNSISEALVLGTPMVLIPFSYTKFFNAQCVKKLEYACADKNNLKYTVFSVLSDSTLRNNLTSVQELINKALGNKGGAEIIISNG